MSYPNYYTQGFAKAYTAYDQCFSSTFYVGSGLSRLCVASKIQLFYFLSVSLTLQQGLADYLKI